MARGRILRIIQSDADYAEELSKLIEESLDVLKRPLPDTFLGRKTQEPFPKEKEQD